MRSDRAAAVWSDPGWAGLIAWILRRVPECDPTIAAVHAVRNRDRALVDPGYARSLVSYVCRIARGCTVERPPKIRRFEELTWDPPEPPVERPRPTDSLAGEVAALFSMAGVRTSRCTWSLIASAVEVAVDWWDGLASRTGLVGDELVVAARQSRRTTGNQRLRANFDGPTARPLVALLVGGDQSGRSARRATGSEAGLLYWALLARHAVNRGLAAPVPPEAIRRAWATHVDSLERAISSTGGSATPEIGPTVAA